MATGGYEYAMPFGNDNGAYLNEMNQGESGYELNDVGSSQFSPSPSDSFTEQLIQNLPSNRLMTELTKAKEGTLRSRSTGSTMRKRKTFRSKSLMYKTVRMRQKATSEDILQKLESDELIDDGYLTSDGKEALNAMPVNLSNKREVIQSLTDTIRSKEKTLSADVWLRSNVQGSWSRFKRRLRNMSYYIGLWQSAIKKIEGLFGSSVTSYFLFLKWLFLLNIFTFFLMFCFQVLPQLLYRFLQMTPSGYKNNSEFEAVNIFNGKGWMADTELFYGFYTNETIFISDATYLMPYAYFYSAIVNYLFILCAMFYSIARSYKENYIEATTEDNFYFVTKMFTIWDYSVISRDAAALRHRSIHNEIKEYLSEFKDSKKEKNFDLKMKIFLLRLLSHILVLGLISGCGYVVYYLSTFLKDKTSNEILQDFGVPVLMSASNLLLPLIFTAITHLESYELPQTNLYVTMVRTMLLSIVNMAMLCLYWSMKVIRNGSTQCWETFISQEIYRLVVVDFFFTILYTLVFEVTWFVLHSCQALSASPKFNIATTTLDLVYSQALCWLGLFYAPLMPLLMVVKLFFIFHIKWASVICCCSPSKMIWRASRTHTIFLGVLLLYFVLTVVAVAISIYYNKPSVACGPFSQMDTAYDLVSLMVEKWQSSNLYLKKIVRFISQRGFIFVVLIIFCVIAYYSHILLTSHRKMVKLLKYQLDLEGKNKQFLLTLMKKERQADDAESSRRR
ncbi:transmembrane channel-like protein 5 [Octopus sinensis]|uniref:Transmembrane channel-like protein 5 n=1 Tax=Octopus sinensis TaxID=2607531 RepID=A0A6P7SMQ6_9MOLL|nr:transmembrane channel-like protein 5 [Octopus sinensis]